MPGIRLPTIPDRRLVKLVVQILPELEAALTDNAAAYENAYGKRASIADLVDHMLNCFLVRDGGFAHARRK